MVYREIHESIFELPADYYLVNCISADFSMRKRMNAEFNRRYNIKKTLQKKHPEYAKQYFFDKRSGDCILEGRIFTWSHGEKVRTKSGIPELFAHLI